MKTTEQPVIREFIKGGIQPREYHVLTPDVQTVIGIFYGDAGKHFLKCVMHEMFGLSSFDGLPIASARMVGDDEEVRNGVAVKRRCVICEDNDHPATVLDSECSDYCQEVAERNG